jgi:hypothetical protein
MTTKIKGIEAPIDLDTASYDAAIARANRSAETMVRILSRQIDTFGMTAESARLYSIEQRGASDANVQAARAATEQLAALRQQSAERKRAGEILKSLETPTQQYTQRLAELDRMTAKGLLTQQQHAAAAAQLRSQFSRLDPSIGKTTGALARMSAVGTAARASLNGVGSAVSGVARRMFSMQGAILAAVGGGGMAYLMKQSAAAIDSTAKLADAVALTTEELVGYQLAAKISGVAQTQFDTAIVRFQKVLGNAKRGSAEATRALELMGLTFADLENLTTDEQLKLVSDQFKGMGNQVDKSSALLTMFGESGLAMGKMLENGSEGISRFQAEADKLGTSFSRIDAAQVELANDAMTRLQGLVSGVATQITINVAPAVEAMVSSIVDAGTEGASMGDRVSGGMRSVVSGVGTVNEMIDTAIIGYQHVKIAALSFYQAQYSLIGNLVGILAELPEWLGGGVAADVSAASKMFADELGREIAGIEAAINDRLVNGMSKSELLDAFDRLQADSRAKAEEVVANAKLAADGVRGIVDAAEQPADTKAVDGIIARLQEQVATLGMSAAEIEQYKLATAGATAEQLRLAESLREQVDAFDAAAAAQKKMDDQQKDLERRAKSVADSVRTPFEEFEDKLADLSELVAAGVLDEDTFRKAADQAISQLDRVGDQQKKQAGGFVLGFSDAGIEFADASTDAVDAGMDVVRATELAAASLEGALQQLGQDVLDAAMADQSDTGMGDNGTVEVEGQDKVIATLGSINSGIREALASFNVSF